MGDEIIITEPEDKPAPDTVVVVPESKKEEKPVKEVVTETTKVVERRSA